MNNCFAFSRDAELQLEKKLAGHRLQGACLSVMRLFVTRANHTPSTFALHPVGRGEIVISLNTVTRLTGLSRKTIRNVLRIYSEISEIEQKGAHQGANRAIRYMVVNYDGWDGLCEKGANEGANWGPTGGQLGATSKEEVKKKEGIEELPLVDRSKGFMGKAAEKWSLLTTSPPPFSMFNRWKKMPYPEQAILDSMDEAILHNVSGDDKSIIGYISTVLKNVDKRKTPDASGPVGAVKEALDRAKARRQNHV